MEEHKPIWQKWRESQTDLDGLMKRLCTHGLKGSSQRQDDFALSLIPDNGFFLDIGMAHPIHSNNTWKLEQRGWHGLMIEVMPESVAYEKKHRTNTVVELDVTNSKLFADVLNENVDDKFVDYLSFDVDDASVKSFPVLMNNIVGFGCATIEHDNDQEMRSLNREILHDLGYRMIFEDVSLGSRPFEDWWINPWYFSDNKKVLDICERNIRDMHYNSCISTLRGIMQ